MWNTISSWDWQIISSCVAALATVFYTIGTFLLWNTTRKTINAMQDAFKLNFIVAVMQAETPHQGQDSRTDMFNRLWHQNRWKDILKRVFPDHFEFLVANDKEN